jgi:putative tryptophan/tyrosine transport system substrate-binding protein
VGGIHSVLAHGVDQMRGAPFVVATWAFAAVAGAQEVNIPVVGFLTSGEQSALDKQWVEAFNRGLGVSGYIDGKNITVKYRFADNKYDRLDGLAAEFVSERVGVIIAAGGPVTALAAKRATSSIPIVFTTIADPVQSGVVANLNRPGGNATGTAGLTSELDGKRLELLREIKPTIRKVGVLINPKRPGVDAQSQELQVAANKIGVQLVFQDAGPESAIDAAFEKLAQERVDGLVVTADPFFNFRRTQVIGLATRHAIPAIYQWREFVTQGGLMSYGPSIAEAYNQAGIYAGQILKGSSVGDLPVVQPRRFETAINLKTAKSLGINVPRRTITRADEVVE